VARELGLDPDDLVKLSSNENPFGPSPAAAEAIHDHAGNASMYPKSAHTDLRAKVAEEVGVSAEQVWLSPSGDVGLDYLARATIDPGQRVLVPQPGFAYYPMSARYHHGEVDEYHLDADDEFAQTPGAILDAYDGHRVVYVTSPHNPTGSEMTVDDVRTVAEESDEQTLVVLDEAYHQFSAAPTGLELVEERDDVALLRTFSKAYGLAGLRIGYAVVPEAWGDAYSRVSTPFAANEVALRAALAALDDDDHVERSVESARWAREYIRAELDAPTYPSEANFVLCAVGDGSAVAEAAQERGVIVRDCTSFGLPECIRVSCGTEAQTRRAVETLNEVLADRESIAEA